MTSNSENEKMRFFDEWAATYDRSVQSCQGFPFAGYDHVLKTIIRQCEATSGMSILDLGIGTGKLAQSLQGQGCQVWGLDISSKMIAVARKRVPGAKLFHADMQGEWPKALCRRFDSIVSGYALHHLDLASKIMLLKKLFTRHLANNGKIIVGDIGFETSSLRSAAQKQWVDSWDPSEHYWAADETHAACEMEHISMEYTQVSICGGVFVFQSGRDSRFR